MQINSTHSQNKQAESKQGCYNLENYQSLNAKYDSTQEYLSPLEIIEFDYVDHFLPL